LENKECERCKILQKRCAGLQDAVRRWQKKAGKEVPEPEEEKECILVSAQMRFSHGGLRVYTYSYQLCRMPHVVEGQVEYVSEYAYEIFGTNLLRVYYDRILGWIAVAEREV